MDTIAPIAGEKKTPLARKRLRGSDLRFMGLGRVELPPSRYQATEGE